MGEQTISIIIPMYNEASNLVPLYAELKRCLARLKKYRFEVIFVDDGSEDDSAKIARRLARQDRRLRVLELSRNFGKEPAMTAGLHAAAGDAAMIIDADLQMPPRLMGKFLQRWEDGDEVVIGVFEGRKTSRLHKFGSHWFYRIMQQISTTEIIPHSTDFRLIDRKVINEYNRLTERNRITRGLIDWLGFKRSVIPFEQAPRLNGTPAYTLRKLIGLAVNSFTAESLMPLKLAGYLGALILVVALPVGGIMTINRLVYHWPIRGTAFLAIMIVALVGLVLACLGLISLYIGRIHAEASNRPLYVVRDDFRTRARRRAAEDYEYVPGHEVMLQGVSER
ncbi:MAG TPA: glycosyltransferase family 2 protein [Candidatus Saccharimonadales bacterium]|nr:glycosyltransferase family 2 protein [Candidatus Saccharimonadales bacterium]